MEDDLAFQCETCGCTAFCVGFMSNLPSGQQDNPDTFYCTEHCEHDRCATVAERILEDYFR